MKPGKRLSVFAVRTVEDGAVIWVRAGVAYVQPDGALNITLDVLPIDGKLIVRDVEPKKGTGS